MMTICLILGCIDNRNPQFNKTYWNTSTQTTQQINYVYREILRNNPVITETTPTDIPKTKTITIASWNLQRYGPAKGHNITLINYYISKIKDYDIAILLEVTDENGDAIRTLADHFRNRSIFVSNRVGTPGYKEQYIVFYKNVILKRTSLMNSTDIARYPLVMEFTSGNWTFNVIAVHLTPEKVSKELAAIEHETFNTSSDIVLIGDLNAGCDYYTKRKNLLNWTWTIPDTEDTTSGNTTCAYDRIVLNTLASPNFINYGVMRDVTTETDHYLIYGVFNSSIQ